MGVGLPAIHVAGLFSGAGIPGGGGWWATVAGEKGYQGFHFGYHLNVTLWAMLAPTTKCFAFKLPEPWPEPLTKNLGRRLESYGLGGGKGCALVFFWLASALVSKTVGASKRDTRGSVLVGWMSFVSPRPSRSMRT